MLVAEGGKSAFLEHHLDFACIWWNGGNIRSPRYSTIYYIIALSVQIHSLFVVVVRVRHGVVTLHTDRESEEQRAY